MKLSVLQDTLDTMKGRLHNEKFKYRKVMTDEESKCKRLEDKILQLNKWIFELDKERKVTKANEQAVKETYITAVTVTQRRLNDAQDKIAEQAKAAKKQQETYAQLLEELKVVSAGIIGCMQKEWDDKQHAHCNGDGGQRQWPSWVVQLICELLISVTPPRAVPLIIQTFSEILLYEKPKELPSVSFVRECHIIVKVIGEAIAAIKLARAPKRDQLWYDGTTH